MGEAKKDLIVLGLSDALLTREDLLATGKLSSASAARILSKYSSVLPECCFPMAAIVPLELTFDDEGVCLNGEKFGNGHVASLLTGHDAAYLYYVTCGAQLESAECFCSSSMRDVFAFAALLKITETMNEWFRDELKMSEATNLFTEAGRELTQEDLELLTRLGTAAREYLGIRVDSRGLMRPWNTLRGLMYEKALNL